MSVDTRTYVSADTRTRVRIPEQVVINLTTSQIQTSEYRKLQDLVRVGNKEIYN